MVDELERIYRKRRVTRCGLVAIGGSWGGVDAACRLLRSLEPPLPVPVLLVLHRSRRSERALLETRAHP